MCHAPPPAGQPASIALACRDAIYAASESIIANCVRYVKGSDTTQRAMAASPWPQSQAECLAVRPASVSQTITLHAWWDVLPVPFYHSGITTRAEAKFVM